MSKVKWRGGRSVIQMGKSVKAHRDQIVNELTEALQLALEHGAAYTQENLEAAETRTGVRRVETGKGAYAGRHLTGKMVGAVSASDLSNINRRMKLVMGAFGWFSGDFEQYMRDQDLGEGNIPAARALPQAFARSREEFRASAARIIQGKRG